MFGATATLAACALPIAIASAAVAHEDRSVREMLRDQQAAFAFSQNAIGSQIGDHAFVERDGTRITLAALRGRPIVINMIYTSCAHTCSLTVQTIRRAVEAARSALGRESVTVLTVGFDVRNDTPARLRDYARQQDASLPDWLFVAADHATIDQFSAEIGFLYAPTAAGFDHLAQTTIVDGEGRIFRQIYGADFPLSALVEPLKELALGRRGDSLSLSAITRRIRLLCTVYDASADRYRFSYAIFLEYAVGFASLLAVGVFLARAWRQTRRA